MKFTSKEKTVASAVSLLMFLAGLVLIGYTAGWLGSLGAFLVVWSLLIENRKDTP